MNMGAALKSAAHIARLDVRLESLVRPEFQLQQELILSNIQPARSGLLNSLTRMERFQ
jgi:hypothetical protein